MSMTSSARVKTEPMTYLEIQPESIKFNYIPKQYLTSILTLKNLTKDKMAYKLKSTQPKCYLVKPNIGVIEPLQKVIINFTLHHTALEKGAANFSDRFQLLAIKCTEMNIDEDNVEQFFKDAQEQQVLTIQQLKVNVEIIDQNRQMNQLYKSQNDMAQSSRVILLNNPKQESFQLNLPKIENIRNQYKDYAFLLSIAQDRIHGKEERMTQLKKDAKRYEDEGIKTRELLKAKSSSIVKKVLGNVVPFLLGIGIAFGTKVYA